MTSAQSHGSDTASVSLARLQRLEACEARADLQAQHIELLQKQIAETGAALKVELARGEKHAEAMMHIARTCDERTSEIKEQHAAALRIRDAATAKLEDDNAALEADNAALNAKLVELATSHAAAIKLDAQHKEATTKLEAQISKMETLHKEATTKLEVQNSKTEAQHRKPPPKRRRGTRKPLAS
jgi:chromosome segregation ATPase